MAKVREQKRFEQFKPFKQFKLIGLFFVSFGPLPNQVYRISKLSQYKDFRSATNYFKVIEEHERVGDL